MAVSTESAGRVRQRCLELSKNPGVFYALKSLFLYLAANKGNPDLEFLPFTGTSVEAAGGQVLVAGACKIFAVWGKKPATDTEDAYLAIFDDATDDTGAGTDGRLVLGFQDADEEQFYLNPDGLDMATGVVAKSYTDFDGTTDTTAGQAPNGFVIIGE